MDVVYPYRYAPRDLELKYSLRSLVNLPHEQVIISGDRPRIVSGNVKHVATLRRANRYASSTLNILAAAERKVRTERFVVMNDDMFILKPWTFTHENRGTVAEYLETGRAKGDYLAHILATVDILKAHGVDEPLWFGLHTPTVYERAKLIELVREFTGKRYLLRTLYHNLFPQPSARRDDVKLRQWAEPGDVDIVSTSDECGRDPAFIAWVNARFPEPSPYEAVERRKVAA